MNEKSCSRYLSPCACVSADCLCIWNGCAYMKVFFAFAYQFYSYKSTTKSNERHNELEWKAIVCIPITNRWHRIIMWFGLYNPLTLCWRGSGKRRFIFPFILADICCDNRTKNSNVDAMLGICVRNGFVFFSVVWHFLSPWNRWICKQCVVYICCWLSAVLNLLWVALIAFYLKISGSHFPPLDLL